MTVRVLRPQMSRQVHRLRGFATQPVTDQGSALIGDELATFLTTLDDYTPTIPDSVTAYFLQRSGVDTTDQRM